MNNLEFRPQESQKIMKLLKALTDLYEELEELNDDELQNQQKMKYEDPLRFLNLNQQNQSNNCSNQIPLKNGLTKRNNLIIENSYYCRICFSKCLTNCSFGRHFQQYHQSKNLLSDSDTYEQLSQRQQQ